MRMVAHLFQIALTIFVGLYAICFCVVWFGMFARIAYLVIRAFWRRGFAAFRVSYKGNTFNDVA
jgi:hypothetical protein